MTCELRTHGRNAGDHVVRVRVLRPDGIPHPAYERNVIARNGVAQFAIPLALNDPPGNWTVVCRDVATGMEGRGTLRLGRGLLWW